MANKHYNAEVTGSTYDHLFIRVTDNEGFLGGAGSWRHFEELIEELRIAARNNGYSGILVNMLFK